MRERVFHGREWMKNMRNKAQETPWWTPHDGEEREQNKRARSEPGSQHLTALKFCILPALVHLWHDMSSKMFTEWLSQEELVWSWGPTRKGCSHCGFVLSSPWHSCLCLDQFTTSRVWFSTWQYVRQDWRLCGWCVHKGCNALIREQITVQNSSKVCMFWEPLEQSFL